MTTRLLPVEEWPALVAVEPQFHAALSQLSPASTSVLVVEDDGVIVGAWTLITMAHVEGLWVAPAHRKRGRVLVKLWAAMQNLARLRGFGAVLTTAQDTDVRRLALAKGAQPIPGDHFVMPVVVN